MTSCCYCGKQIDPAHKAFIETVNLTPDGLFVGPDGLYDFKEQMLSGVSLDWCDIDCFGCWLNQAYDALGNYSE